MSAVATVEREATPRARIRDDRRPSMARVTKVELHKMFDTRSGFWLPIGVALAAVITVLITALSGPAQNHTFTHLFGNALIPTAILLPLIGVLLVTGEFSQRTALTTFTLVPSRARVMWAKLAASVDFPAAIFPQRRYKVAFESGIWPCSPTPNFAAKLGSINGAKPSQGGLCEQG